MCPIENPFWLFKTFSLHYSPTHSSEPNQNPIDYQGHRVKFLGEGIRHALRCPCFEWDDDEVGFVLDQYAELDFYSAKRNLPGYVN
jgi:hypothetical protein